MSTTANEPGQFILRPATTVGELRLALADLRDDAAIYVGNYYGHLTGVSVDNVGDVHIVDETGT